MKVWDALAMCLLLLSVASTSPLLRSWESGVKRTETEEHLRDLPPSSPGDLYNMEDIYPEQFEDVVEFIQATIKRLKRSPDWTIPIRGKRDKIRQRAAANTDTTNGKSRRGRGKNRGCVLKDIHLNVTDLDLGYQTKEELIFRYCSGSCNAPETTYDLILKNLTKNKKLVKEKVRTQVCCRPIAFDDDLAFLDDNLVYHTLKKHSAKKCGCI
ncbi:glial cell line-derived neurotrophic factor-like isoform X1 [Polypterus senegalus]|nr:glial cell line-derived neurotrophic factor-like isoform X1 [Polypterus senegalus]